MDWVEFEDHHRYTPDGVDADCSAVPGERRYRDRDHGEGRGQSLRRACDELLAPLPLYWLQSGMRFDDEEGLMAAIESKLAVDYRGRV